MKLEGYLKLSARLDDLINFQDPDNKWPPPDNKWSPAKASVATATGIGLTQAASYGLYRRGQALGNLPGVNEPGGFSTPGNRGILGNIGAGARAIPGDVRRIIDSGNVPNPPVAAAPVAAAPAAHTAVRPAARARPNSPHLGDLPSVESLKKQLAKLKKVKK